MDNKCPGSVNMGKKMYLCFAKANLTCSYLPYIQVINTWTMQRPAIIVEFHYIYPRVQGICSDYRLFSTKDQALHGEPYANVFPDRGVAA